MIENGCYSFISNSTMNTYGYIYNKIFNRFNLSENLILSNDDNVNDTQFKLTTKLQNDSTYVLVVTTFSANITGNFSVIVFGLNTVGLNHIRE